MENKSKSQNSFKITRRKNWKNDENQSVNIFPQDKIKLTENSNNQEKIWNSSMLLNRETAEKIREFHKTFPMYEPTPLAELKETAKYLGLGNIYVKDESFRFGLNAFKVLGGSHAIGKYLASYLEAAGYTVQMTRKTDTSLADTGVANEKLSDFKNRTAMITQAAPMAVISIHQNSYPAESVKGTQVFHSSLTESKLLASCIQEQCRRLLDPDNHRQIKENNDYYLFRHISCPIVIVECGFLSNYMEANLLITEDYQKKTAWAIYMGTVQFLKMFE